MRIKRKYKKWIPVGAVFLSAFVWGGTMYYAGNRYYFKKLENYQKKAEEAKRQVYVPTRNIFQGETITKDIVKKTTVVWDLEQSNYFSKESIGKTAVIDIPKDTPLLTSMVCEEETDDTEREVGYRYLVFENELKPGDYVDVRIRFLDGEDYIVNAKRKVVSCDNGKYKVTLLLSEEERLMLSSAIMDSSMYQSSLYLSKYTEPTTQEASVVTYQPYVDVIDLITSNVNITKPSQTELDAAKRMALEKRLFAYQKAYEKTNGSKTAKEETPCETNEKLSGEGNQKENTSENIINYYDYAGQGIDAVLDSLSNSDENEATTVNKKAGSGEIVTNQAGEEKDRHE